MTFALPATRRGFLAATASAPLAAGCVHAGLSDEGAKDTIAADLARYIGFGNKQSGGPGDEACGAWMEQRLRQSGFATTRQAFDVPFFDSATATLSSGAISADVWPQPIVRATGPDGLRGRLVRVDASGNAAGDLGGAIALVDLAHARWSSMFWPGVKGPVDAAFAGGAAACVIVTNGPTGKVIRLNTDGRTPLHDGPIALLAPADAAPFFAAAIEGATATLVLDGMGGRREAFNLVGKLDRGAREWIVVSTPRSGWTTCAGERGGGVAAWMHLARLAPEAFPGHNLAFVCNSGHEYQYLGAEELIEKVAPPPERTRFWLHLGANFAARDWHDTVGQPVPLPGTDSQRYLVVSPPLQSFAREAFAGLAGLEAPYTTDQITAGELANIVAAGYARVAGIFGVHRYHHVEGDDERCVSPAAVVRTTQAFHALLREGVQ